MAKKEKIQYPNPKFWKTKDEINWAAQLENLKEVGAISMELIKATDWKQLSLCQAAYSNLMQVFPQLYLCLPKQGPAAQTMCGFMICRQTV